MLKKRYLIAGAIVVVIIALLILYNMFASYGDYTAEDSLRVENAGKTSYAVAFDGILSYNPDGAALLSLSGEQKWNISFEMQDPRLEKKANYAIIFDRQGTAIEIVGKEGEVSRINASFPITSASLSAVGNVAVVMQQQDVAHVVLYDAQGNILAGGELHGGESGFPMAISLSDSGDILGISNLHLSESDVKNEIVFYDFSDKQEAGEGNKAATFTYADDIIPVLDHGEGKIIAVGTNSVKLFNSGNKPVATDEFFYANEIKSFAHNDRYFGVITEEENEEGNLVNVLSFYSIGGKRKFSKEIDAGYSKFEILDNDEIFFTDGKNTSLYTTYGVKKFEYEFAGDVQSLIPAEGNRNYYLLENGELKKIRLRQ